MHGAEVRSAAPAGMCICQVLPDYFASALSKRPTCI